MAFISIPVAFLLFIMSLIQLYKAIRQKTLRLKQAFLGILLILVIYIAIFTVYYFSDSAYALGAALMFTFFMIIAPALIGLKLRKSDVGNIVGNANIFFICAVVSGILIPVLSDYTIDLPEYLGIPLYH